MFKFLNSYFKKDPKKKVILIYQVLLVIFILTTIFYFYKFSKIDKKYGNSNPYPMIDLSRNFIPQSDFITNLQPLREDLNNLTDEFGREKVSVYIEYLNTGANISINQDNYIWPASLLKLPLAMTVMKKVQEDEWNLSDQLVLMKGDVDQRSGDPTSRIYNSPVGTRFTVEELTRELTTNSDNSAYDILARNTTNNDVQRLVDAIGLDKLATDSGKISAKEYSRLLRSLYTASFLNRENSQKVLEWLDESTFEDYLAYPLPDDVKFPHKYGKNIKSNVYADSGIVYITPTRSYIISVMVQGYLNSPNEVEEAKAKEFMHTVSKKTYEYFKNYKQK